MPINLVLSLSSSFSCPCIHFSIKIMSKRFSGTFDSNKTPYILRIRRQDCVALQDHFELGFD